VADHLFIGLGSMMAIKRVRAAKPGQGLLDIEFAIGLVVDGPLTGLQDLSGFGQPLSNPLTF